MKFSQEDLGDDYRVHSYDDTHVVIQQGSPAELTTVTDKFVLTSNSLMTEPNINALSALTEQDSDYFQSLGIEVLILGQSTIVHLKPQIQARFSTHAIGVEQMHIGAACRTYNLLVSEGRKVALAIDFDTKIS